MATDNNPIKYSDLVQPDNAITQLITQLEELQTKYAGALKDIRIEAQALMNILKSVNGATGENRDRIKESTREADKLAKAKKALADAESENAVELQRLKQATAEQNQMNKMAAKLADSTEGSYKRLSAQYSINKIALNNMSAEERKATKYGQELEKETRDLYEEMKRLQEVTGMNQLNVGNYANSMKQAAGDMQGYEERIKSLLGLNNEFGDSLFRMSASGQGASGTFQMIGNSAKAFGATLLTLLANPVFLVIAGLAGIGAAFKFWYDYNMGIVEATRLTKQFTDLSGDGLKMYRNEVQAIADMYDKDFKEVLIGANAIAKQFGITQEAALKAVKDGFIAGADANGEFLENIKEYPAYFKEAGISARAFVAITAQANKAGIYSDKGIDAIKEGNLRIREMTDSTFKALEGIGINAVQVQKDLQSGARTSFDVMQEVSRKLNELPAQSAVVGTAIADIFGGPGEDAGLQYLKTLKDIDTDLNKVKDSAGKLGKLQEERLQSQIKLENELSALLDQTGGTFEELTTMGKIFLNEVLIELIKGIRDFLNYFIDLYNESVLFRAIVAGIKTEWQFLFEVIGASLEFTMNSVKNLGKALHGAFTLDFGEIKDAFVGWGENIMKYGKRVGTGFADAVVDGAKGINNRLNRLGGFQEQVITSYGPDAFDSNTNTTKRTPISQPKGAKPKADDSAKKAEELRKHNLELVRKYEDTLTNLIQNEFEKRRQIVNLEYQRQTDDLRHQLATDKQLNEQGRTAIRNTIKALALKQTEELTKIANDQRVSELNVMKTAIQSRLDAVRKGTEEEFELRKQMIDTEEELALKENDKKDPTQRQGTAIIKAQYQERRNMLKDEEAKLAMMRFDFAQDAAQSEFDLLYNSENRKTKFRLEQEKKRLQKILELNKTANTKLSEDELRTIQNTIKKIDQEIANVGVGNQDIYEVFGLNLGDDQKEAINESVSFAISQLSAFLDSKVQIAEQAVAAADKEVEASQKRVDAEIQARNEGYASSVVQAQKDLDLARKQQEQAEKDKEKAVKRQQQLDTITQTSSLITASANIWSSLSVIPIVGTALAVAALALMWGSFIASKAKAKQVSKTESYGDGTVETLQGGSHQSGNDIDLGTKPNGTRRRAEGGEMFAVFNKRTSRKNRSAITRFVKAANSGSLEDLFYNSYKTEGITINANGGGSSDLKQLETDVSEIRKQNERRYFIDENGYLVEIYKNLKRTRKK